LIKGVMKTSFEGKEPTIHDSESLKGYNFLTVYFSTFIHVGQWIELFGGEGGQTEFSRK